MEDNKKDTIESLLQAIENAQDDFANHRLSFEDMEQMVKELKMRVDLIKMKETVMKIANVKKPKSEDETKIQSVREIVKQKTNEISDQK